MQRREVVEAAGRPLHATTAYSRLAFFVLWRERARWRAGMRGAAVREMRREMQLPTVVRLIVFSSGKAESRC